MTIEEDCREEYERKRFEVMAYAFFERWQPDDLYEARQFSAELFCLIREIYAEAAKPIQQALALSLDMSKLTVLK